MTNSSFLRSASFVVGVALLVASGGFFSLAFGYPEILFLHVLDVIMILCGALIIYIGSFNRRDLIQMGFGLGLVCAGAIDFIKSRSVQDLPGLGYVGCLVMLCLGVYMIKSSHKQFPQDRPSRAAW